jgi:hypothetical protein
MLPPDGESDRFLTTKDLKLVGYRRGKFVFCYVVGNGLFRRWIVRAAIHSKRGELTERAHRD